MAITSNRTIGRIEIYPLTDDSAEDTANAKHPSIMVVYNNTLTGTGADAHLNGQVSTQPVRLYKFQEDGGDATDVSGEDALVQTVANAIWA